MQARLWPLFGLFAVAAMWAASAYANFLSGVALADEARMQWVLGGASVACDVLKGAALFIVVGLALKKHWVAASVAVVIFALCTTWSLRSAVYFAASAMDGKMARIEAENRLAEAKLKVIGLKAQRAEFLSGQSVEVDVTNKYARKDAIVANKETSAEFRALVGEVEQGVKEMEGRGFVQAAVDPIASTMNIDPKSVVLFSSLFFAVLLEMGSSWGFWLIARAKHGLDPTPPLENVAIVPEVSPPQQMMALGFGGVPVMIPVADAPKEKKVPPPKQPVNVVDSDEERMMRALGAVLAPAPGQRVLMSNLGVRLNEQLPPLQRLDNRHSVSSTVTKYVHRVCPGAAKAKIAGQMWVMDVRLRDASETASLNRSKA